MTFSSFSKKIIILEYKKVRQLTEDIDLLLRYDTFAHVFKSSLSKSNNSQSLLVNIQHAYDCQDYVSTSFELH